MVQEVFDMQKNETRVARELHCLFHRFAHKELAV